MSSGIRARVVSFCNLDLVCRLSFYIKGYARDEQWLDNMKLVDLFVCQDVTLRWVDDTMNASMVLRTIRRTATAQVYFFCSELVASKIFPGLSSQ